MAIAGHSITLERVSASTSMSAEATTLSGGNTIAQVTDTARRLLDPTVAMTVLDNGIAATNIRIDPLFGRIIKTTGAFTGPVTISANYYPRVEESEPISFSADCVTELIDTSLLGEQDRRRAVAGLQTASGEVVTLDTGSTWLATDFDSGVLRALSVDFGNGVIFRALVKLRELARSVATDGRFELTYSWEAAGGKVTGQTIGNNTFGWSDLSG